MKARWLVIALMAGCTVNDEDDVSAPEFECCEAAPVLQTPVVVDAGTAELGGTTRRVIALQALATDADGDLWQYTARVWYDTLADGTLPDKPKVEARFTLDEPSVDDTAGLCHIDEATVGAKIALGEDDVPPGEQVEFGLVILDAAGHMSNDGVPVIVVATTPDL